MKIFITEIYRIFQKNKLRIKTGQKGALCRSLILILLPGLIVFYGCASQDDLIILHNRLLAVEKQNEDMAVKILESENNRKQLYSGLKQYNKNIKETDLDQKSRNASLHVQINKLKDEIERLSGKLEESEYRFKRKTVQLEKLGKKRNVRINKLEENTNRINNIEKYLDFESTGQEIKDKSKIDKKIMLSEDDLYHLSKQAFDNRDFETARNGFVKFIKKYPKSNRADNAQFWIGEIYFREKWFEKAIVEYQKTIDNYPGSNKMIASLLKQGYAFYNLGDKKNARLIFKELIKKYPKSDESKIAKKKLSGFK